MAAFVELAGPGDDEGIRGLVRRQTLPGRIRLALPREPDFSLGCSVTGGDCRILVARSAEDGAIVGVACRSVRRMFVNGREQRVGYLGQLRIDERFRGRWLVSRGFSLLAGIDRDDPVPFYLASIVDGNAEATGVLVEKRRRRFPVFREAASYRTLALRVRRPRPAPAGRGEIVPGSVDQLREVACFLRAEGARRQFFSVWTEDVLAGLDRVGLRPEDVRVARRDARIVGVAALWDQTAYKQTVVRGYSGWLKAVAPFTSLPRVGQEVRSACLSLVCIAGDDQAVFAGLLREIYSLAHARRFEYLLVGLDARDPLLGVARGFPHIAYPSRLYVGSWSNGDRHDERLDDRPACVDIATL